jgi:AcrR family transcriptional regulator
VARARLHSEEAILDAARGVVLERGARAASVAAIAEASGAPVGSLYHSFGSRDALLARLWVRAATGAQAAFVAAVEGSEDPVDAAVAGARATLAYTAAHPADARLLVSFRREDLMAASPPPELAARLAALNAPVEAALRDLARRLFGRADAAALRRTTLAAIDLPQAAIRRHLLAGRPVPAPVAADVEAAVRATLAAFGA